VRDFDNLKTETCEDVGLVFIEFWPQDWRIVADPPASRKPLHLTAGSCNASRICSTAELCRANATTCGRFRQTDRMGRRFFPSGGRSLYLMRCSPDLWSGPPCSGWMFLAGRVCLTAVRCRPGAAGCGARLVKVPASRWARRASQSGPDSFSSGRGVGGRVRLARCAGACF